MLTPNTHDGAAETVRGLLSAGGGGRHGEDIPGSGTRQPPPARYERNKLQPELFAGIVGFADTSVHRTVF